MSHTLCSRASVSASGDGLVQEVAQRRVADSSLAALPGLGTVRPPHLHDHRIAASAAARFSGIGRCNTFRLPTLWNRDSLPADVPSGDLSTCFKDGYR
jgi:hypothetical protein